MRAILELARKDLVLLMRDRAAAFFTFVFPLAIALFFGYVFGGTTSEPVKVAAWVERPTPATERLVRALGEDGAFVLELVPDRDAGEQLVRRGRAVALVTVPGGYDEELSRTFTGGGARMALNASLCFTPKRCSSSMITRRPLNSRRRIRSRCSAAASSSRPFGTRFSRSSIMR